MDPACGSDVVLVSWFRVVHGFVQLNEISIGSMMLSEVKTKCGREELVRMEALRYFELEVCGGVALGDDSRR